MANAHGDPVSLVGPQPDAYLVDGCAAVCADSPMTSGSARISGGGKPQEPAWLGATGLWLSVWTFGSGNSYSTGGQCFYGCRLAPTLSGEVVR